MVFWDFLKELNQNFKDIETLLQLILQATSAIATPAALIIAARIITQGYNKRKQEDAQLLQEQERQKEREYQQLEQLKEREYREQERQQEREHQRLKQLKERQYREQERQQDLLQTYLKQMATLIVDQKLTTKQPNDPTAVATSALTVAVIKQLNPDGIKQVKDFLIAAGLARLTGPNLLSGVDLQGINLENVDLSFTNLRIAKLEEAKLINANLEGAKLEGAILKNADLTAANLEDAKLWGANLKGANLENANLKGLEWGDDTEWEGVKNADKAYNISPELRTHLEKLGVLTLMLPAADPLEEPTKL